MGTYSEFFISIDDKKTREDFPKTFGEKTRYDESDLWFDIDSSSHRLSCQKWYNCEEDMIQISQKYKDVTFVILRVIEDSEMSLAKFKNGLLDRGDIITISSSKNPSIEIHLKDRGI